MPDLMDYLFRGVWSTVGVLVAVPSLISLFWSLASFVRNLRAGLGATASTVMHPAHAHRDRHLR
jgi:hypothetical protein